MTMALEQETHAGTATSCVACGHDAWTVGLTGLTDYLTQDCFNIARCDHCGLQMTQPLPFGEAIGRYYPKTIPGKSPRLYRSDSFIIAATRGRTLLCPWF